MPLFLTLKNGLQILVQDENIKWWRGKKVMVLRATNGHRIALLPREIIMAEVIPLNEYERAQEEAKRKREQQEASQGRIARPALMVPRKTH